MNNLSFHRWAHFGGARSRALGLLFEYSFTSATLNKFYAVHDRPAFTGHPYVSCLWILSNAVKDISVTSLARALGAS